MLSRRGFLGTAALVGAGAVSGRVQAANIPEAPIMDKATMQGVVRRLKERGLVDPRPDPGDARRTLLSLTTEGKKLVNRLLLNGPAVSRETLKPLSAQEQKQLLDLLSRII